MDDLVADSGLCLTLTNQILEVLLKALLILQEAHGYVIIRLAVVQLREKCPFKIELQRNECTGERGNWHCPLKKKIKKRECHVPLVETTNAL